MATWPEARAAKAERDRRESSRLKPGPPCPVCKGPTSAALVEATGDARHPVCMPTHATAST